jgi:hypothetical protein
MTINNSTNICGKSTSIYPYASLFHNRATERTCTRIYMEGIAGHDGSIDHGFEGNKHGTTRAGLDEENGRRESSPSGWRED